jgi:hypothetical protein
MLFCLYILSRCHGDSDLPFGIFWPLCCLFFFDIRILIYRLVSSNSSYIYLSKWHQVTFFINPINKYKKSLKIPNGKSESVYRRRTDNTMAKRYQRVNQNPYIEEEQTTQWPKEKVQKDNQWSTKHTYKTKDRAVLLRYTDSDLPFGIFWPLCCLFFFDIRILIYRLVSSNSSYIYLSKW